MSVKYIATKTQLFAGRGNEVRTYSIEQGKEIPAEMANCSATLISALESGSVRKEGKSDTDAPETKSMVSKAKKMAGL